jgi:Abnormal spindle-like microcephaly-assoc'd, ASPM-SPD-2-Hydin
MRKNLGSENSDKALRWAVVVPSLLLALAFLVGCQGLSSGGSAQPATTSGKLPSNLIFGSASVSFGSVPVGSTKATTFTAKNSGSAAIVISSVAINSQNFSLTSPKLPVTLAGGQSTPIGITFAPNDAGTFTATATVISNALNATASISLTGSTTTATTTPPPGQTAAIEFHIDPWMGGLNCSTPDYTNYIEPYMVANPGGYLVFTIPWALNDTGITAPNYTWGADSSSGLLSCISTANGGTYTGSHPQPIELLLWVATDDTGTPNYNYGTPVYVYDPTYATSVGASRPNDSLMCSDYPASGLWTNASHHHGDGAGFTTTQLSQGLPVPWETPFITARNAYMTAAFAHYSALLGNQLFRLKPGLMAGATDEQHDFCTAQQDVLPGISPSGTIGDSSTANGLWLAWMTTISGFLTHDTSPTNNPNNIPLIYSINREEESEVGQWMDDEATRINSVHEAIGYQGVTQADIYCWLDGDRPCSEYWQYIFMNFSSTDVEIQTTSLTQTNGTGEGTVTEIIPALLQACGDTARRCDFEEFSKDTMCQLVPGYSSSPTCNPQDPYYPIYPLVTSVVTPCSPTGTVWTCELNGAESIWDTSQSCTDTLCTYSTQPVPSSYDSYQDAAGTIHTVVGGTVPVGSEPVLLFSQPSP